MLLFWRVPQIKKDATTVVAATGGNASVNWVDPYAEDMLQSSRFRYGSQYSGSQYRSRNTAILYAGTLQTATPRRGENSNRTESW